MKPLVIAIFGNTYQEKKSVKILQIINCIRARNFRMIFEREYYEFLTNKLYIPLKEEDTFDGDCFRADFVLSIGGDGTFLKAASHVKEKNIPILGLNMGRLGFLADLDADNLDEMLERLVTGDYHVEERAVLELETEGTKLKLCPFALNEIAILKHDISSMISIRTCINGDYLVTYQSDGLIISTPTGSTAYSLSVGGPIMVPGSGILALSPVAPHSLNIRPIVMRDDVTITLDVASRSGDFLVAIDGQSESCGEKTRLTIRRAPYTIKIIQREDHNFFQTLHEKMMWGADPRVIFHNQTI